MVISWVQSFGGLFLWISQCFPHKKTAKLNPDLHRLCGSFARTDAADEFTQFDGHGTGHREFLFRGGLWKAVKGHENQHSKWTRIWHQTDFSESPHPVPPKRTLLDSAPSTYLPCLKHFQEPHWLAHALSKPLIFCWYSIDVHPPIWGNTWRFLKSTCSACFVQQWSFNKLYKYIWSTCLDGFCGLHIFALHFWGNCNTIIFNAPLSSDLPYPACSDSARRLRSLR